MKHSLTIFLIPIMAFSYGQDIVQKLTFHDAVQMGLTKNVNLNQQKNLLLVNNAQRLSSYGNYLPSLNLTGLFQQTEGQQANTTTGGLENLSTKYFETAVNGSMILFNGLGNLWSLAQFNNQALAQGYQVKRSSQDVISTIAIQYLQVYLDQELLRIALENLNASEVLLEQIKGFYEVGARAIPDVHNQDALVKSARVTTIQARNDLENDRAVLAQTLQLDISHPYEVSHPIISDNLTFHSDISLDSLISIAIQNRPDLQQQIHQVSANKARMKATFSGYLPTLTVSASYGSFYYSEIQASFEEQMRIVNPSLSFNASISIPLFNRFSNRLQHTNDRVLYENSVLDQQNLLITIRLEIRRAINNLAGAVERYNASIAQLQASELALLTQKESYELGVSDQVALAQANQTYVAAAASKAQAEVTVLFQKIQLSYALGTLQLEDVVAD